jgi:hypothetical protein
MGPSWQSLWLLTAAARYRASIGQSHHHDLIIGAPEIAFEAASSTLSASFSNCLTTVMPPLLQSLRGYLAQ